MKLQDFEDKEQKQTERKKRQITYELHQQECSHHPQEIP